MTDYRSNKFLNFTVGLLLLAFIYIVLKEFQSILIPLLVAVIISIIFEPLYRWLKSKKVPGIVAIIIIVVIILVLSNIISLFVFTSISSFQTQIPKYQDRMVQLYDSALMNLQSIPYFGTFFKEADIMKLFPAEKFTTTLEGLLSGILGIFGNFVLILIYVIFILSEIGSIRMRIRYAFSREKTVKIADIVEDVFDDVKKYIVGKTLINFSHAVITLLIFWIFGLDFAVVWAFLTFFMAFIPNIGAIIATILPFLTALLQYDNVFTPVLMLIILSLIGYVMGNIVEPKIFGHSLNLSPVLLIVSLIFWGYLWGIVGMILSVPLISMLKIIFSKFEKTKPFAILMSNVVGNKKTLQQEIEFK